MATFRWDRTICFSLFSIFLELRFTIQKVTENPAFQWFFCLHKMLAFDVRSHLWVSFCSPWTTPLAGFLEHLILKHLLFIAQGKAPLPRCIRTGVWVSISLELFSKRLRVRSNIPPSSLDCHKFFVEVNHSKAWRTFYKIKPQLINSTNNNYIISLNINKLPNN